MADRKKIIKALTECIFLHENPDDDEGCLGCPYRPDEKGTCPTMIPFLKDVLELLKDDETQLIYRDEIIKAHEDEIERLNELLKEQEPVKPIDQGDDSYVCDNCGETVGWEELDVFGINPVKYKYCPGCGRKVKWNAVD